MRTCRPKLLFFEKTQESTEPHVGLPDAFCKNTGHFVDSSRSKLCRNS